MVKRFFNITAYEGSVSRRIKNIKHPNPKRVGSKSAIRYDQYRDGMTVAQYIHACEQIGQGAMAIFDITWDTDPKRRFIELFD